MTGHISCLNLGRSNCPTFRQLAKFRAERCWRLRHGMADEWAGRSCSRHLYPTKTKRTGDSKNNRRRVATRMHCDSDTNSHQSVGANAAHEGAKERQL